MSDDTEFEDVRAQAKSALDAENLDSIYLGLLHEDGAPEFYFGSTVEGRDLHHAAVDQLGMLTRVLADRSDLTPEELANLAAERADELAVQ
ncbi:hypothetical protein U3A55_03240 [Salarchaeum sp. III]|uniref:hypothetical protein n=1 Tax=Salarchaeum sp. III TaxID=3107927 RepID=UPI002EDBA21A